MSQEYMNSNFNLKIKKRNYNEMMTNSINLSSNKNSFIKDQYFKSALKFGGPINQDLIIHHKKNVRKTIAYNLPPVKTNFDIISLEKEENKPKEENKSFLPEKQNINSGNQNNNLIMTEYKDNKNNKIDFGKFYSDKKQNNKEKKNFALKTEIKLFNYDKFLLNNNKNENVKKTELVQNTTGLVQENSINDKEKIIDENGTKSKIASNDTNNNPFLAPTTNNTQNNNVNPFNIRNDNAFVNSKEEQNQDNKIENPFRAISKQKLGNPFTNFNQFQTNNLINDNINNKELNPFKGNNKPDNPFNSTNQNSNTLNPFISSTNNPFNSLTQNPFNSSTQNPFNSSTQNPFNSNIKNPFTSSTNNPFISSAQNPFKSNIQNPFISSTKNPFKPSPSSNNPFISRPYNNPFLQNNNNDNNKDEVNPFLNNASNGQNPFLNSNNKAFTNPFKLEVNNNNKENKNEEEEENINVEEEIKIEKDENQLKLFKEVKYEKINKFYEVEIQNLQYLKKEKESNKSKYISLGAGMLTFQEEGNNGKKKGIMVLRDIATKNIKIQGLIIKSSDIEKMSLKSGLEFIMVKNIFATYTKYNKDNITQENQLTYFRIKVEKSELETLFSKGKEFFELMKK